MSKGNSLHKRRGTADSEKKQIKNRINDARLVEQGSLWRRGALITCLLVVSAVVPWVVIMFFRSTGDQITTFASADNIVKRAVQEILCSKDYDNEEFSECKPKHCRRVVMDNLVSEEEAAYLLGIAKKGLQFGGSSGGASILDLHSGALSKGDKFVNIYQVLDEMHENVFTKNDFDIYREVKNKIHQAIAKEFKIPLSKLYLTKPTFFSRMNTIEAKTMHDEYWHPHVDKVTYGSFHYTSLLYLSTYGRDFSGGRFIFVDTDSNKTVEPRIGRVSFFTSGSENVHYVEKLEDGVRYAITISFTCDPQKAIDDPGI
ncbi:hypothetical protein CHS0354_034524 [Potamilus streckersoni]|uniref:Prolyl 4-hydroxylase alpha subunit domain-containing protein n=1 Tax=Potamilus streckersoni TaxID=2493646 RepID=A0AAE0SFH9_9BIVA|nr:hypothetical protein CHS0354_034524 [Potamilus streckersoni]